MYDMVNNIDWCFLYKSYVFLRINVMTSSVYMLSVLYSDHFYNAFSIHMYSFSIDFNLYIMYFSASTNMWQEAS